MVRHWGSSLRVLLLAALGACGGGSQSSPSASGVRFDESTCPFLVDASQVQGSTMRCGILYTPEVHASPTRLIEVPVLVFKGKSSSLPPIVNLSGGPGQSWADLGLETFTASDTKTLSRDWVFIEQRGTGLSRPRLDCPLQGATESDAAFIARCVQDLRAQGPDVGAYNLQETAEDVATFQSVLGYPKIALDGVSYGTAWGLQILRAHSAIVSSAVLDSVVDPAIPFLSARASATGNAFATAFAACASESTCKGTYGDLSSTMATALESLKASPLTVAGSTATYDDYALFDDATSILAFAPELLPRMITAVSSAVASSSKQLLFDSDVAAIIGGSSGSVSGMAFGQYLSMICADNQFVTAAQVQSDAAKVSAALRPYADVSGELSLCAGWPYQIRTASDYSPVTSAVATMLVSGSFNPLTNPNWAKQAAQTLSNGYWVEFPGLGHDEGASADACPQGILSAFLQAPGAPNTSCVADMTVSFAAPNAPITVVVNSQRGAALPGARTSPARLVEKRAMRSRVENVLVRRHLERRMAELVRGAL